jgi:hypothetical protein
MSQGSKHRSKSSTNTLKKKLKIIEHYYSEVVEECKGMAFLMYSEEYGIDVDVVGEESIREDEEYIDFMTKCVTEEKAFVVSDWAKKEQYPVYEDHDVFCYFDPKRIIVKCKIKT